MIIYLFGATTLTGQAFIKLFGKKLKGKFNKFFKKRKKYKYLNLEDINTFSPEKGKKLIFLSCLFGY